MLLNRTLERANVFLFQRDDLCAELVRLFPMLPSCRNKSEFRPEPWLPYVFMSVDDPRLDEIVRL